MMKGPSVFTQEGRMAKFKRGEAFYRVIFACLLLVILSFISSRAPSPAKRSIYRRSQDLSTQDEECRLVHQAPDQCAFVKANCADEEAGLVSYLGLYFCSLGNLKPLAFIIIVSWMGMLFSTIGIAASDFFCVNLSSIATLLGLNENLAGVTFLAFGNGSPDVFSTFAAMGSNSGSLAVGELIGAAGFITAVVAGSMAFIRPFKVAKKSFIRDVGFFIIAASFSLGFLIDGQLQLWESLTMVGIYIFYVILVVTWHWYFNRRRRRRNVEAAARSQYIIPGSGAAELGEEYHDDEDNRDPRDLERSEDLTALERGGGDEDEEDEELLNEHFLGQISNVMRVSRPRQHERRNTLNPIRPSLVGALEFRSVLSALERSRNIQAYRLHPRRRYSADNPSLTVQQQLSHSMGDLSEINSNDEDYLTHHPVTNRPRAVSAIDASNLAFQPNASQVLPRIDLLEPLDDTPSGAATTSSGEQHIPKSPAISISPPSSPRLEGVDIPPISDPPRHLAPPGTDNSARYRTTSGRSSTASSRERLSPNSHRTSETASFTQYFDEPPVASPLSARSPIILPTLLPESALHNTIENEQASNSRLSWWPYSIAPPPQVLLSTLFPTLYDWREKGIAGKILGIIVAPSVFLLTITLPVVEIARDDCDEQESVPSGFVPSRPEQASSRTTLQSTTPGGERSGSVSSGRNIPTLRIDTEHLQQRPLEHDPSSDDWNRWLVIVQVFTAPFFIVLIIWANTHLDKPQKLLRPALISLLISFSLLAFLLGTTNPLRIPKWHPLVAFLGFVVSISWISTIAGEVVGVLKAVGVILDISDAILGLTIFAVGNSLGDLVANVTVARFGFPVMALSACFGGPMLNILLGIGLSGSYMTITGANERHKKHPNKQYKFKPFMIDVDRTLIISGVALLVTLVGLLIVIPVRKWMMDRVIGWGLILMWLVATIGNLTVEIWFGKGLQRDS